MTTRLASQPRSSRRRDLIGLIITGLFSAASMAIAVPALQLPTYIDQLTIVNPHAWAVNVDVTDRDRTGWIGVGAVERDSQHTFHAVIDQGDAWTFHFAYSGEHAELRVSRIQLERNNWHVTVPDEFADQLRGTDIRETPP